MNGAVFDEKSQVSYILKSLSKSFLQFISNVEMNKIEYNLSTLLKELQIFQSLKGRKEGEVNVAHSRRFAPSSSRSKKIQKRKGGKGKVLLLLLRAKGRLRYPSRGNVSTAMLMDIGKETALSTLLRRKKRKETSSFKQIEEGEMTLKVRTRDVISAGAMGDAKYGYLYLMEHKSEAFEKFKEYKAKVENLLKHGIQSQLSAPGTPEQNGVSERRNITLLDMVRSMMSYAQLPSSFWGYAVETAVHILNNVSLKSVSETPFELWRERKPSLSHFRIWVCPVHVLVTNHKKLEPRSRLCQFVGYPKETRGGLFFDPQENRVFISTNATFLEEDHMRDHKPRSKLVLNETTDESTRVVDEVGPPSSVDETTTSDDGVEDPLSYKQTMNDVDKDQWVKAMDLEMESMYFNSVWELVDLSEGPEGFITQGQEQKVCKLNRSIYGLKQASRSWNIRHGVHLSNEQFPKTPQEVEDMRRIPYASTMGSLMYVMLYTRPDICYAVGIVGRYQSNPRLNHWTTAKIILKYLRKSMSGSVFTLNGRVVVWRSIKQGCIVDSTIEAKYVAAC
ncbi:gag/pol protein [Cucumis melo var. makuwa]|uniref:Gag/pol protein n=1 Tax=Cucumis melo var. makuwa TaxID=1194695 RepID=A0A5D3CBJ4_CUCMM|nr:gag/pol protein [Cucumis melo var. makuwa]